MLCPGKRYFCTKAFAKGIAFVFLSEDRANGGSY
jgi:hypothetical protein